MTAANCSLDNGATWDRKADYRRDWLKQAFVLNLPALRFKSLGRIVEAQHAVLASLLIVNLCLVQDVEAILGRVIPETSASD